MELEFYNEVGTGLGPTLEFYTLACREVQRKSVQFERKPFHLWRDENVYAASEYVHAPKGLFPAPISGGGPKLYVVAVTSCRPV